MRKWGYPDEKIWVFSTPFWKPLLNFLKSFLSAYVICKKKLIRLDIQNSIIKTSLPIHIIEVWICLLYNYLKHFNTIMIKLCLNLKSGKLELERGLFVRKL